MLWINSNGKNNNLKKIISQCAIKHSKSLIYLSFKVCLCCVCVIYTRNTTLEVRKCRTWKWVNKHETCRLKKGLNQHLKTMIQQSFGEKQELTTPGSFGIYAKDTELARETARIPTQAAWLKSVSHQALKCSLVISNLWLNIQGRNI